MNVVILVIILFSSSTFTYTESFAPCVIEMKNMVRGGGILQNELDIFLKIAYYNLLYCNSFIGCISNLDAQGWEVKGSLFP